MGDRYFDLGNFAVNNELVEAQETALLEAYFGDPPTPGRLAALRLMRPCPTSARRCGRPPGHLRPEFDFSEYAAEHSAGIGRPPPTPARTSLKEAGAAAG